MSEAEAKPDAAAVRQGCLKLMAIAVLVVAGIYAIGLFVGRDPWADQGVAVEAPKTGTAKPSPTIAEPEDDGIAKIEYDLQERVIATAGVLRPTTADCELDDIPNGPRTFGCTVTFDGTEVPFEVRITKVTKGLGMALFEWEIAKQQAVLTKEGVFAEFWRDSTPAKYTDLRCDDDIPTKKLVALGPTEHFCYFTTERGKHHRSRVVVDEHGLNFVQDDDGEMAPKE